MTSAFARVGRVVEFIWMDNGAARAGYQSGFCAIVCTGRAELKSRGDPPGRLQSRFTTAAVALGSVSARPMEDQIKESLIALMDGIKRADGDAVAGPDGPPGRHCEAGPGCPPSPARPFPRAPELPESAAVPWGRLGYPAGSCGGRT